MTPLMSAKPLTRIKVGSVSLPFYKHQTGWRWAWKGADGVWHYGTRTDYSEAVDAAKERATLLAAQTKSHLDIFGERANHLRRSVDFVLDRRS